MLVRLERIGLALAAVQRQHQMRTQALAIRMLAYQRLELADQLAVLAERVGCQLRDAIRLMREKHVEEAARTGKAMNAQGLAW